MTTIRQFALLLTAATGLAAAAPPNIISILSDDLAQGDVGVYGQKLIETPRLDRMAAEGTRFTQAYCGTTVCAPSRASLMTGLHSGHCPIRANREIQPEGQKPLPAETVTVAEILKSAGYAITLPHGRHEIDKLGRYSDQRWPLEEKSYAAQVTRIDSDVGELLDLLKELAIDDNTLVIISGDNGSSFASESKLGKRFDQAANGLRGFKRSLYEGALRQACIARWPGTVPAAGFRMNPGRSGISCPPPPNSPVRRSPPSARPTASRWSPTSRAAPLPNATISTGNSMKGNRSRPRAGGIGKPCATEPHSPSKSTT